MSFGYNYPQQQQQQQSLYQIVSQPPPTYVAGHSIAPHNDHNHPNTAMVHYQNLGLETAVAMGNPQQQYHTIATIDPTANNNSVSHVQWGHNDSAITSVQQPQQQLDDVGGGNIDQPFIVSSDKRSTSATSINQTGGGGNLAHCA
jgi:hypothetical protein